MFNPVVTEGPNIWSQELKRLQDEIKRLRIINVIGGTFEVKPSGTTIICNGSNTVNVSGSAASPTTDIPVWR